jgi:hypothetical protein
MVAGKALGGASLAAGAWAGAEGDGGCVESASAAEATAVPVVAVVAVGSVVLATLDWPKDLIGVARTKNKTSSSE